jgi:Transposase DDE domain
LRHTTVNKDGKTHSYWRLVRSVPHGRKVFQETVAHLGELDAQGRARARRLALEITGACEQCDLFEAAAPAGEPVAVCLEQVRLERARRFGDVWLGWRLWCALGLDRFCAARMAEGRERVPWATMAAILVIARLCEPSSELHIAEDWYRRTALSGLLGVPEERVNDDRLYRALDQLLPHKQALEAHLKQRLGELFALDYDLLRYDVTSSFFAGEAGPVHRPRRGHSRDHRGDCKQVCIGLVVTRAGIPLGYEVFAGNRTDVTTVEQIVGTMERRYGQAGRVWVMDRGMTSAETVAWLQATGRGDLIGANKAELKKLAPQLTDARDWRQVRDRVAAKLCADPDGNETFVLVRSADRRAKEQAMHARFCERIETALVRLAGRLERPRSAVDRGAAERQIGRRLGRNTRAAGRYAIRLVDDATVVAGLRLEWSARDEWDE